MPAGSRCWLARLLRRLESRRPAALRAGSMQAPHLPMDLRKGRFRCPGCLPQAFFRLRDPPCHVRLIFYQPFISPRPCICSAWAGLACGQAACQPNRPEGNIIDDSCFGCWRFEILKSAHQRLYKGGFHAKKNCQPCIH